MAIGRKPEVMIFKLDQREIQLGTRRHLSIINFKEIIQKEMQRSQSSININIREIIQKKDAMRTSWIMQEYRINDQHVPPAPYTQREANLMKVPCIFLFVNYFVCYLIF